MSSVIAPYQSVGVPGRTPGTTRVLLPVLVRVELLCGNHVLLAWVTHRLLVTADLPKQLSTHTQTRGRHEHTCNYLASIHAITSFPAGGDAQS